MNSTFNLAALGIGGPRISYPPVARPENSRANMARYYFFSPTELARDIQNTGVMNFVAVDDGNMNYTDKNHTGIRPTSNSRLVLFTFGPAPLESHLVVNPEAYKGHRARSGTKFTAPLRATIAASRPDLLSTDFDPQANLG